jgi:hypothetical protein
VAPALRLAAEHPVIIMGNPEEHKNAQTPGTQVPNFVARGNPRRGRERGKDSGASSRAWLIGLESLVTASVGHGLCSIDVDLMTGSLNLKYSRRQVRNHNFKR